MGTRPTELPHGDTGREAYRVEEATWEEVRWIARLEAEVYSPSDAIPEATLGEWYEANPAGFSVIKRGEERIGHVDILPLRPTALRKILGGELAERDVRGADLYPPGESDSIRELYVESLALLPRPASSRAPAVSFILANFTRLAGRLCDPAAVESVYATAASGAGERLMSHLGFVRLGNPADTDRHGLWAARFSEISGAASTYAEARGRKPVR
jgi:hypothetical protein